ncbi:MAG: DUF3040 domain-containing protein [Streptosporangiaceae bacterium]
MSLAPNEQRALAGIEVSLRRSDPGLATMLATFTVLPSWDTNRRWAGLPLRWSRIKPLVPVALAFVFVGLIILGGLLLGHTSQPSCTSRSGHVSASAVTSGCAGTRPIPAFGLARR